MIKRVNIETSAVCNLSCEMCPTLTYGKCHNGIMNNAVFDKVLAAIKTLQPEHIDLTGWGEPMLDPDLFTRAKAIKQFVKNISVTTNLTLLHLPHKLKQLLDSGINLIDISFDGSTAEVYEKIRKNSSFEQTFANIKTLSQAIQGSGKNIILCLSYIVMQRNKHEIDHLFELLEEHQINAAFVTLKFLDTVSRKENFAQRVSKKEILEIAQNSKYKSRIQTWNIDDSLKPQNNCLADPLNSIFITWQGQVTPCCILGHPVPHLKNSFLRTFKREDTVYYLGDLNTDKIDQIWQNPAAVSFRETFLNTKLPAACKHCDLA